MVHVGHSRARFLAIRLAVSNRSPRIRLLLLLSQYSRGQAPPETVVEPRLDAKDTIVLPVPNQDIAGMRGRIVRPYGPGSE